MAIQTVWPSLRESKTLSPRIVSERIVQAVEEAKAELVRQGKKPTIDQALILLGRSETSGTTYNTARNYLLAINVYGISERVGRDEAIRRMRLLNPASLKLAKDMDGVERDRSDPEMLADAIHRLIVRQGEELPQLDAGIIAGFLMRDPEKRGATRSAIIDLIRWLTTLEKAL